MDEACASEQLHSVPVRADAPAVLLTITAEPQSLLSAVSRQHYSLSTCARAGCFTAQHSDKHYTMPQTTILFWCSMVVSAVSMTNVKGWLINILSLNLMLRAYKKLA